MPNQFMVHPQPEASRQTCPRISTSIGGMCWLFHSALSSWRRKKEERNKQGNANFEPSPQLVTPRRSLFSSKRFGAELRRGKSDCFEGKGQDLDAEREFAEETMTTPPLLSSSPATNMDMMDMSPLPHKIPFTLTAQIELLSPTPDVSSTDLSVSLTPSPLRESPIEGHQPKIVPE